MIWGWIIAAVASIAGSAYYQKKMAEDMAESQSGMFVNKAGASEGLRIIYGRRRVGAIKAWKGVTKDGAKLTTTTGYDLLVNQTSKDNSHGGTRDGNDWLHRLDVWGQGPIDAIETFHIDGDEHTNTRFTGRSHPMFRSVSYYGSETQTAPANLVSVHPEITSSMRGKGVAYSWNRFLYRDTDIQYQGEPNVTATVRGLKVWDPRTNPTDSTIKTWSNNPALCLLDYLMADYGKGLSEDDMDIDTFIAAANSCDTTVTIPAVTTNTTGATISDYFDRSTGELIEIPNGDYLPNHRGYQGSSTSQVRFQCDVVLNPKDKTATNVEKILKTMKGTLPFSQGQYKLILEDTATSVMSFDDDNTLGNLNITFSDRSKRLNRVTIKFPNRNKDFEDDMLVWPDTSTTQYTNYLTEDQGEDLHTEVKLEGVTDFFQAQDLAEFIVKESRSQMFIDFKAQPSAMVLEPGDIIEVTHGSPSWTNKEFRVRELTINSNLTVNIKAQEYDSSIFNWGVKDPEPTVAYEYINPFITPDDVQNVTTTSVVNTKADGTKISGLRVGWDNIDSNTNSVDKIFVGYKLSTDTDYSYHVLPRGETSYDFIGLNDNTTYDVNVYYRDIIGKQSDGVTAQLTLPSQTTVIDTITTDITTAQSNATTAAAAAAQAISDAATAQAAADAAQATADAAGDSQAVQDAQDAADAAQATADAAAALAATKQTAAEVTAAIAADTTAIDGSRITTGTIDLNRLTAVPLVADDLSDTGTTVIDGGRITTGTLDGASITATTDVIVGSGSETAALSGDANDDYRIWSGASTGDTANFSVDKSGAVVASAITIADNNGSVMFDSNGGFTEAAKSQILGDVVATASTTTFDQAGNSNNTNTVELLESQAVTINYAFIIKGEFVAATTQTGAQNAQVSSVTATIKVGGTSIGSDTKTAVYNTAPSSSQFRVNTNYYSFLTEFGNVGNYYSSVPQVLMTGSFTTTLATGVHTISSDISQNIGTAMENGAVSITTTVDSGAKSISLGSTEYTISTLAPTTVGATAHGHVFYTY